MKQADRETLDRLGEAWGALPPDAEPERRLALAQEIFEAAYQVFPEQADAIGAFFEKDWPLFDGGRGKLSAFFSERLGRRQEKLKYKEQGGVKVRQSEERQETPSEKKRGWVFPASLDQSLDGDGGQTLAERYDAEQYRSGALHNEPLDALLYDETALSFLSLALVFPQRLSGRAANPQRLNYFRMFFTDSVVDILHGRLDDRPFLAHERDLFQAMQRGFLDFFMAAVCRSVPTLAACPVKPYGAMVPERPMTEPRHPLPNDVYMTYLNTEEGCQIRSAGTVSNQRKEYERFMRENLC